VKLYRSSSGHAETFKEQILKDKKYILVSEILTSISDPMNFHF